MTVPAVGGINCTMVRPSVDLPQPDSPTTPSTSISRNARGILSQADVTGPLLSRNSFIRVKARACPGLLLTLRFLLSALRRLKKRQVFAVPFFLQFLHWNKTHRSGVDAVTLTGRGGAIAKDVTEMGVTFARTNLSPLHAVGRIPFFHHAFFRNRFGKTWPSRAAVEFI